MVRDSRNQQKDIGGNHLYLCRYKGVIFKTRRNRVYGLEISSIKQLLRWSSIKQLLRWREGEYISEERGIAFADVRDH